MVGTTCSFGIVISLVILGMTPPAEAEVPVTENTSEVSPEEENSETIDPDTPVNPDTTADDPGEAQSDFPGAEQNDADVNSEAPLESNLEEPKLQPLSLAAPTILGSGSWTEKVNSRLAGGDRYATAVAASQQTFPATSDIVVIAVGTDFPDSLSAAALAAKLNAPLLLTNLGILPQPTANELKRLKPQRIVIVGGTGVVTSSVEKVLKTHAKEVVRVSGGDRYATSAAVSKFGWGSSTEAFIATGTNYADALTAGAAAAYLDAPVLLVPGMSATAPASIRQELTRLNVKKIRIAGGTGSVSSSMQKSVGAGRTVVRYAGGDRYDTGAKIARGVFTGTADTYWAYGLDFADALAGSAVAGVRGSALLLVQRTCVPTTTYAANDLLAPGDTYLLGGTGTLTNGVMVGNECMTKPSGISNADWSGTQRLYSKINEQRYASDLSGLRVSDNYKGTPARSWAKKIVSSKASLQSNLSTKQPWVRYQAAAITGFSGGTAKRVDRAKSLIQANNDAARWLYQPNGGSRGFLSVGYVTSGSKSAAVVFVGAGLNK
ncbi:MAG: cell wall-binding repeat-containing protein [Leucobacter sp.]